MIARPVCAPNVVANDAQPADRFADDERRRPCRARRRRLLGHVGAEQPELAARRDQRRAPAPSPSASSRSMAGITSLSTNSSAVCADQPMLVGQLLGREDAVGAVVLDQPRAAFACVSSWSCRRSPSRHRLEDPRRAHAAADAHRDQAVARVPAPHLVRSVAVSFAPVQPSGWPSAIAPPLTFSRPDRSAARAGRRAPARRTPRSARRDRSRRA